MEIKKGYKMTDVGVIPEDWEVKSIGEMYSFKNGLNKDKDSCCRLWSSSLCLNNPGNIYYLLFKANYINMIDFYGCGGQSVRPVINL